MLVNNNSGVDLYFFRGRYCYFFFKKNPKISNCKPIYLRLIQKLRIKAALQTITLKLSTMSFKIVLVPESNNLKKDILPGTTFELYKVFGVINVNFINLDAYHDVCRFI